MSESAVLRSPSDPQIGEIPTTSPTGSRRGGGLYFIAALVAQAMALLRYVVLARLLGPEQLGIAATLVVTASLFDMISDTGGERFLIQDRDGGLPQVQNLVQSLTVGRGVVVAALLLVFSIPIAWFYHTPRLTGGLAIMALSPLIAGFAHLDNRRVQREHDFRPEAISSGLAEVASFAATVAAAWLTRDFTAVLYGVIARAVVNVLTSHLQAKRPYRLGWDREHAPRLVRFAAPLMLNGLLVFIASQGDRVLVGRQLGLEALGYYSAIMLLIFYPTALLIRYQYAINIPLIAAQRDHPAERERAIDHAGAQTMLLAVGMAVGFAVVAPVMVPVLFGGRFAQAPLLVGMIGCLQTARFMINWPTTVALATGRSTTVLFSNLAHGLAFVGAFIGLSVFGGLTGLLSGFIVGELGAVATATVLVNRNLGRPLSRRLDLVANCAVAYGLIIATNLLLTAGLWWALLGLTALWIGWAAWLCHREWAVILGAFHLARRAASALLVRLKP